MNAHRWAEAAATFRALAERRPDLPRPRLALARAAAMAGDCAAARSELTRIEPQRSRLAPAAGALHLTRASDLLELELPPPDLTPYRCTPTS